VRWLLLFVAAALAGPVSPELPLGREIRVSVGDDHVFVLMKAEAAPADLGRETWADFDRDADGSLDAGERVPLLEALQRAETEYTALSVGEQPLTVSRYDVTAMDAGERTALDATVQFKMSARAELPNTPGGWPFVFYDRPRRWQGAVPIRLSVARDLKIEGVEGARTEKRSDRRVDTALTNPTPMLWGRIVR
jgi:hypothetical protein